MTVSVWNCFNVYSLFLHSGWDDRGLIKCLLANPSLSYKWYESDVQMLVPFCQVTSPWSFLCILHFVG